MKNIFNRILLKAVLLPAFAYKKYGINMDHLRSILTTKLIMDDRRPSGFQRSRSKNTDGETSMATLITMLVSFVMGCVFLLTFQIDQELTRLTVYFGVIMIMLSLFLITDFTYVLIDVKDNFIILPKPVNSATFLASRLLHILIHLTKIVLPITLPGFIATCVVNGIWGALLFIPIISLLVLFTIFVVNASYLLILKIFSPEKFKSIITSVQIGFTIVLYASYQLFPRLMGNFDVNAFDISQHIYAWLIPSFWFAGAWQYFYTFSFEIILIICVILSIVMPLVSIWLVIKYFAPTFQRKLSLISSSGSSESKVVESTTKNKGFTNDLIQRLAKVLTSPGVERGSFLFAWKFTGRSREFKMKVFPQFGYMAVLIILLFIRHRKNEIFQDADSNQSAPALQVLGIIYLCCFVFLGALYQMPYSENFKAGWVFFSSPIEKPGKILSGAVKATILKFCAPMIIVVSAALLISNGGILIPNMLFGFANVILLCVIFTRILLVQIPFTVSPRTGIDGSNSAQRILMFLIIPVLALPQFLIFYKPVLVGILTIIPLMLTIFVLRYIKNISWDRLNPFDS